MTILRGIICEEDRGARRFLRSFFSFYNANRFLDKCPLDNCRCGYLSVVVVVPGLVGVVSQIKAMPLFVAVDVQGGEGAPDLLEGDEGGGVGEHEVLHQLLAGHPADLKTIFYISSRL